jgi:large subunit ribosomal protein L6
MSRIANQPVEIASGVTVTLDGQKLTLKGSKGEMSLNVHPTVSIVQEENKLVFKPATPADVAMAGTMRSLVNNMMQGVTKGYEKKLKLVGVGYRAALQGRDLNLSLGFSHPVVYKAPEGITFDVPSQTEITISGIDKQKVGQVAAEIRAFRPPEPYKGKGVRYADEQVFRKEAKKA